MVVQSSRGSSGITLIEMMVVVAIFAVVAALAAPNLSALFINNRLDTANNEFMAALSLARSEAISRGVPVTVGRVAAGENCTAPTRDWTCGWRIFIDLNEDGVCNDCDAKANGESTIRVAQPLSVTQPQAGRTLSLYSSAAIQRTRKDGTVVDGGLAEFIPFAADGRVSLVIDDGVDATIGRATFILCYWELESGTKQAKLRQGTQSRSRAVLLNGAGRTRPGVDGDKDGRPENAFGENIRKCLDPT